VLLHLAIIGTGWFAHEHAKLLKKRSDVKVVAIVGSQLNKAETFSQQFDNAKPFASIQEAIESLRIDAVYICTPPFARGELEEILIAENIPFFVEKPLSIDEQLPEALALKIEQKKLITSVGYHFRYSDATTKMREFMKQRQLGIALGYWMGDAPGGTWWRKQARSGGQFVEQTTHLVDTLRYVCGEVDEVYAAYGQRQLHIEDPEADVADIGSVTLKLKNGSIATISNTCILPVGYEVGLHLYTNTGKLELSMSDLKDIQADQTVIYRNITNPYELEMNIFIDALLTKDDSLIRSTYADALKTHRITMAANQSAQLGKAIKIN